MLKALYLHICMFLILEEEKTEKNKKMLESRPKDALVKLVKTVEIVETVETVLTVLTVLTDLTVLIVLTVIVGFIEDLKKY